ncbi:MAG: hypothetical protein PHS44_02675 [Candidatus Dojkabacteria bacterium]|jgi:hypothetical protein|nr:hypothetical protein [Candidatus Dojkabacteria bacterium]
MTDKRSEINEIVKNFKKLKPGFQKFDVFRELCRICVTPVVEVLPVRKKRNRIEVLLTKRSKDDAFWPDMFHMPGVVLLATDKDGSLSDAFERIFKGELGGTNPKKMPTFVGYSFRNEKRGMGLSLLHWSDEEAALNTGAWFDHCHLPENILRLQIPNITRIVEDYKMRTT